MIQKKREREMYHPAFPPFATYTEEPPFLVPERRSLQVGKGGRCKVPASQVASAPQLIALLPK